MGAKRPMSGCEQGISPTRRKAKESAMRAFVFTALWALAACNGGTGVITETAAIAETETGTDPSTAKGSFTAPMVQLPDGSLESCLTNVGKELTVSSGETVELPVGEYEVTFGSLELATEFSSWLPVHSSPDGSNWIAPTQEISISEDVAATPPVIVSRYVGGQTWTCADATDTDNSETEIVTYYESGSDMIFVLPQLGTEVLSGDTIGAPSEDCATVVGTFISATQAVRDVWCYYDDLGDVEQHTQCWAGEFRDRPTDW